MGHIAHVAKEAIEGQRILKTYGGHEKETRYFEEANEDNRRQYLRKATVSSMAIPVVELFIALSLAGLIIYMLNRVDQDSATVGSFIAFLTAVLLLMPPIRRLTKINEPVQTGIAAAQSVFMLMNEPEEEDKGTGVLDEFTGHVQFRDVSFSYHAGEPPVLMIHDGRTGGTIPFTLAVQACASAAAVGVACELLAQGSPFDTATLDVVDEFLRRELAIDAAG